MRWTLVAVLLLTSCGGGDSDGDGDSGVLDGATRRDAGSRVDASRDAAPRVDGGPATDSGVDAGPPSPPTACNYAPPTGDVVYVATDGSDDTGDGTSGAPWATITHALDNANDGATILVRPGTYNGRIRMRGTFATGVTVRSEEPYMARLRHDAAVMTFYTASAGCEGITVEGFDIAHDGPGASALVVHIDGDGDNSVRRITLRNNVLHDSFNNDVLKINNGIAEVLVERNLFFNQQGSDEHIDLNSAEDVTIQDNIFFNAFEASGRSDGSDTSSYIVVKDSNGDSDIYTGSRNITIRRNVFLRWQGSSGNGFLLLGEDGQPFHEVDGALIENNLFLGDSPSTMRSPFGIKGARNVIFRHNTTSGDLPGRAFAFRFNREGDNPVITGVELYNNIWSDPTGSMGALDGGGDNDFSDTSAADVGSFTLDHNLYWNGGEAIPSDSADAINPTDDDNAVEADPQLGDPSALVAPHWNGSAFADGSTDICGAFERLVVRYGTPASGSAAIDAADPSQMASDDILGQPRTASPDLGAVEGG
ncbi:MAG: DUF1565 domain-containing protein [Myxococcota bacterium]